MGKTVNDFYTILAHALAAAYGRCPPNISSVEYNYRFFKNYLSCFLIFKILHVTTIVVGEDTNHGNNDCPPMVQTAKAFRPLFKVYRISSLFKFNAIKQSDSPPSSQTLLL